MLNTSGGVFGRNATPPQQIPCKRPRKLEDRFNIWEWGVWILSGNGIFIGVISASC